MNNSALTTAVVLDANGMAVKELPLTDDGGKKSIKLPPDVLNVILK